MVPLGFNVATYMGNLLIFFMLFHALNVKNLIRKCFGRPNFSYSSRFNDLKVAAGAEIVQEERKAMYEDTRNSPIILEQTLVRSS